MQREQKRPKLLWVGPISTIGGITVITKRFLKDPQVHRRYRVKVQDQGFFGERNEVNWLRPLKIPLGILRILWNMLSFRPDVVHVHTSYQGGFIRDAAIALIAKGLGARVAMTFHPGHVGAQGGTLMNGYYNGPRWLQRLSRYTIPRLNALVANGPSYEAFLRQEFGHTNVHVIANPVDEEFVAQIVTPYEQRENNVFFAGFLDQRKGVFDLLKAAEKLPNVRFIIYGTAPNMAPFREALARCAAQDRILVDEGYGVEKVIHYMNRARVLALPSYGETLPLIMEEAMAAGLPVIVTPVGVIADYVQDGVHGHIIQPGDIDALAEAINHVLTDPEWAEQVSATNREYGRQFLGRHVNARTLEVYDGLLNGK